MGWAVVLDPYVVCLADNNPVCGKIVSMVYSSAEHVIIVDKGQVLLQKYEQLAQRNPEGWVRQLYEYLVEQQGTSSVAINECHVFPMQPLLSDIAYCCGDDAELAEKVMVGLANGRQHTALVTLDPASRSKCPGGWLFWNEDCYQKVRHQHHICFKFTDSWDWVNEPSAPYPKTRQELEEFLRRYGGGQIQETERLEFKHPNGSDECLTNSIIRSTGEAVCAMANSGGGYVFVGITPDNRIAGIPLIYNKSKRSLDEMQRLIHPEVHRFQPEDPVDHMWPIEVAPERYVFALFVSKKRLKNYTYDKVRYRRVGTQSLRS